MGKWVGGTVAVGGWDWGRWVDGREQGSYHSTVA